MTTLDRLPEPIANRIGRAARTVRHVCGAVVLEGLDRNRCAFLVAVDPQPVTAAGEVAAIRDGRGTWRIFAGTLVLYFFILNAVKLVPYFFLGQFSTENLLTSAVLLPVSIPATLLGVWLIRRIDAKRFYEIVYFLIFAIGAFLIAESLVELL